MATWIPTGTSNQPQAITSHPEDTPTASKIISTLPETNDANPKVISRIPKVISRIPKVTSRIPKVTSMNPKVIPIATATIAAGAKMMRKATNTVKYS